VLLDPGVDVALVGCVPLTGALNTLRAGAGHADDVARDDALANRLARLAGATRKPWVAVVDGGPLFDAMAERLEEGGIPTFRTADRALRALNRYVAEMRRRAEAARAGSKRPSTRASAPPTMAPVQPVAGSSR